MPGWAILVSLIVLVATATITARADDRVPGRYVPAAEERTGAAAASSPLGDVRPPWTERYQALIAGILAVVAAGGGGLILWLTTNRRIDAERDLERDRIVHESTAVARALAGEFAACARRATATLGVLPAREGDVKAQAQTVATLIEAPAHGVFIAVAGQVGVLGAALAEEVSRVWNAWDSVARGYWFAAEDVEPGVTLARETTKFESNLRGLAWRADRLARALVVFPDDEAVNTILDEANPHKTPGASH